ncbi:GTPase IMAP family member 4-like [Hoplias malabaricus]|uniref:GTPase IMAP family member 4-like n=1 Tax=Hoplias malabaricus TaxID=27720 RepID=UPI0034631886
MAYSRNNDECVPLLQLEDTGTADFTDDSEVRIILVGKTGAGKSSAGNTILNREAFNADCSPVAATQKCQAERTNLGDRRVLVVDTPGIFGSLREEVMRKQIQDCVSMSVPGPHAFLVVIRVGRFTEEEKNAVKWIQENFGEKASLYTIILFTHTDQLKGKTLDDFLNESNDLRLLTDYCGGRYHGFNNEATGNRAQVEQLLQKIKAMVERNQRRHYTNEMFQRAQEEVLRKLRILQEEEKRKKIAKAKNAALGVGTLAGATGVVVGGVFLGTTAAVALPVTAIVGGGLLFIAAGAKLIDLAKKKKTD